MHRPQPRQAKQSGRKRDPTKTLTILPLLSLVALSAMAQAPSSGASASSPAKSIGLFAYPKNQQSAEQQLTDENGCYDSAKRQTGVDPQAPPPVAPSAEEQQAAQKQAAQQAGAAAPKGGAVRGSARGAAGAQPLAPLQGMSVPVPPLVQLPALYAAGASRRKLRRERSNKPPRKLLRCNSKPKRKPTPSIRAG